MTFCLTHLFVMGSREWRKYKRQEECINIIFIAQYGSVKDGTYPKFPKKQTTEELLRCAGSPRCSKWRDTEKSEFKRAFA